MKRFETAAACVLTGALITGCAANSAPATPEHTPGTTTTAPSLREINLNNFPNKLPPAVANAAAAVVRIVNLGEGTATTVNGTTYITYENRSAGSGVRVAHNEYLTAGHVVYNGNNIPLPGTDKCGAIEVEVPTTAPFDSRGNKGTPIYGDTVPAAKFTGSYIKGDMTATPDIALTQTGSAYTDFSQPTLPLATERPYIGEQVYALGYEPDINGKTRSPFEANLSDEAIAKGYNKPAEYGGTIIGFQDNGDLIIAEGTKSYGAVIDSRVRAGESGGAIVNAAGQLLALTIEGDEANSTASDLGESWNFTPAGVKPNTQMDDEIAQPVGQPLVDSLSRQLAAAPTCAN